MLRFISYAWAFCFLCENICSLQPWRAALRAQIITGTPFYGHSCDQRLQDGKSEYWGLLWNTCQTIFPKLPSDKTTTVCTWAVRLQQHLIWMSISLCRQLIWILSDVMDVSVATVWKCLHTAPDSDTEYSVINVSVSETVSTSLEERNIFNGWFVFNKQALFVSKTE